MPVVKAVASISQHPVAALAVGEVAGSVLEQMDGTDIDLLAVFIDSSHTGAVEDISASLRHLLKPAVMIGATACGVLGQEVEVEDAPAISVWAASGVMATPLRFEEGSAQPLGGWPNRASTQSGASPRRSPSGSNVILIADPFSTPIDELFSASSAVAPQRQFHGGFASAARGPGGNRLLLDDRIYTDGAVGVDLASTQLSAVVSQGCRPVGNPYTVTGCSGNIITELASQRPLDILENIGRDANETDQQLLTSGIHVGLVFDEGQLDAFGQGDFLIRGVLGADRETGAIAIGALLEVGTTIQFHVRDADSASNELAHVLSAGHHSGSAALTFTCNGRGERLFGQPGHDAELIHTLTGSRATAGMFCAGEFGPVAGANYVHTFTAATVVFS